MGEQLVTVFKIIASLPALLYGTLLIAAQDNTRFWFLIIFLALIVLQWIFSAIDFQVNASWPALVGAFLLLACLLTLARGTPNQSPVPFSHTSVELGAGILLAAIYILWGVTTARRVRAQLY